MSLHDDIMNIPCGNDAFRNLNYGDKITYKFSYQDFRHEAAELALEADKEMEKLWEQINALRDAVKGTNGYITWKDEALYEKMCKERIN